MGYDSGRWELILVPDNTRCSLLVVEILTTLIDKVDCEKEVARLS